MQLSLELRNEEVKMAWLDYGLPSDWGKVFALLY
jgi:hypothetical protein